MSDLSASLPARLKAGTQSLHRVTERTGAMARLLAGTLELPRYCLLLRSLHTLYSALENGLDQHASHPLLQPVRLEGLQRRTALSCDLLALHGEGWRAELAPAHAAARYARRIERLARWHPAMLAAHAYVRYLGDLHGGQALKTLVARRYALAGDAGTAFYRFGDRARVEGLINAFRDGLSVIGQRAPAQVDTLVQEAQRAFEAHGRLFVEIDTLAVAAATRPPL